MVLNAAVQMLKEADELKEKVTKFKSGTSMLQDRSLWTTQQQLQKIYQKVLVLDLDYALDKKVEQDLWNVGFKQQIEALQAISKDKKNPLRSEGQAMLSWVLQAAAGFYLCLLHQICTTFQLDLPFRRRASLLGCVEGWGGGEAAGGRAPAAGAARYICQHCLVHLGDLARYRHQLRVAHTFYRHAVVVCRQSGQPYNQLGLVARRRGRRLCALYWHVRSLLVRAPFAPAADNLARALTLHNDKEPRESGGARRLDPLAYVSEFLRALHYIHAVEEMETAQSLVETLNSSLITLVATNSFESMTLIKMACVIMWAVECCEWRRLAERLADGAILALLLPGLEHNLLPPLHVWVQWLWACGSHAGVAPALWAALADRLNQLGDSADGHDAYAGVPLPEDEELSGFTPLAKAQRPSTDKQNDMWCEAPGVCLSEEPELQRRVRAHRLLQLGKQLADARPHCLNYVEEEGKLKFTACVLVDEELSSLRQLAAGAGAGGPGAERHYEEESDDEQAALKPPIVISEADFREKVREKRAGILKPQGSLERAREERAMATQDDPVHQEDISEESRNEDKKESRKSRVNIAMAAIMRKQEEINKQVKFVSPPPTPDSTADGSETKEDRPKTIQPKPMKSLANLPLGRKTGGILSLKDKSAGYPHLVPSEPERREREGAPPRAWPAPAPRLPVVNPKEIDVRSAALHRQHHEPHKFAHPYAATGDKKSFLEDLPPRFANQFRYWAGAADDRLPENKFRDERPPPPAERWAPPDAFRAPPPPWWKADAHPLAYNNYSAPAPPLMQQTSYFAPLNSNMSNPYQAGPYAGQSKEAGAYRPPTVGQAAGGAAGAGGAYGAALGSFGPFAAPAPYDAGVYPSFPKPGYAPLHVQKPPSFAAGKDYMDIGLGFGNALDMQHRNINDTGNAMEQNKTLEGSSSEGGGNTYSLFSGAPAAPAWGSPHHHPPQSLWSGPGPSPLERLLEQQKLMKPPSQ